MPFDILVKKNATVDDTLHLIIHAINVCSQSPFVQAVVDEISQLHDPRADPVGFIRELDAWCRRNGKYQLDIPGIEEVWTPELTTRMRKFDCKKITVLCAAVLQRAGINPIPKHVYYQTPDGSLEDFTHIYTIVPASSLGGRGIDPYITVDPTNEAGFNKEVHHSKATLYPLTGKKMELHMMGRAANIPGEETQQSIPRPNLSTSNFQSALNNSACQLEDTMRSVCNMPPTNVCGPADYSLIGLTAKDGNTVLFNYTAAEAVKHTAMIPVMFAARAAFLGLIYLGKFLTKTPIKINLAYRLAKAWNKNRSLVRKTWWLMGGEKTAKALKTAIAKGSGVAISGPYTYGYDSPGLFRYGINGATIGEPITLATAGAALVAAGPAILIFKNVMKQLGVFKDGETDPEPPTTEAPTEPPPVIPPQNQPDPQSGSFATHSIDNFSDLLNFCKAAAVMLLGASMNPLLIMPTNILIGAAFLYAIRKKIGA